MSRLVAGLVVMTIASACSYAAVHSRPTADVASDEACSTYKAPLLDLVLGVAVGGTLVAWSAREGGTPHDKSERRVNAGMSAGVLFAAFFPSAIHGFTAEHACRANVRALERAEARSLSTPLLHAAAAGLCGAAQRFGRRIDALDHAYFIGSHLSSTVEKCVAPVASPPAIASPAGPSSDLEPP